MLPPIRFDKMFDKLPSNFRQNVSTKCFDKILGPKTMCFHAFSDILSKVRLSCHTFSCTFVGILSGILLAQLNSTKCSAQGAHTPNGPPYRGMWWDGGDP